MKRNDCPCGQPKSGMYRPATRRGAALIYALVAVLVIAVLALSVGRLVTYHAASENTAQGYARAIYIAEAAAAYQMSRMSRSMPQGAPTIPAGRLRWVDVNTWNLTTNQVAPFDGLLPANDLGVDFEGRATVWIKSAALGGVWTAPDDFSLFAFGTDPKTGIQRGVWYNGTGAGLADRFALFGQNDLYFESFPLNQFTDGVCTLDTGYIGSNRRVTFNNQGAPPRGRTPTTNPPGFFAGCRLGPAATLTPAAGNWTNGWDIPRLPDMVRWPSIDEVVSYIWRGRSIDQCATQNDNAQIQYRNANGTFSNFATPPTQLTAVEFARSGSNPKTIRIRARLDAPNHNLIYLTRIQMGPNDVLLLDLRKEGTLGPDERVTGIRILINNPNAGPSDRSVITNLAYFYNSLPTGFGDHKPQNPTFIWYNNTAQPLTYSPNRNTEELAPPPDEDDPDDPYLNQYRYQVVPELRGLVYGITSSGTGGDVHIVSNPSPSLPNGIKVNCVIGNNVVVRGKVKVMGLPVEDPKDRNRYVLYYRVKLRSAGEIQPFSPTNTGSPRARGPVYDYGGF